MTPLDFRSKWAQLQDRYGDTRVDAVATIVLIGIASIVVRVLMEYRFHTSALLYVGVPYLISLALVFMMPAASDDKWWHKYRTHSLVALIVFLASSIVLFEGFICVVFFLPIYFLVVSIAFLFSWAAAARKKRNGTTFISILPLLVLVSSLEGTTASLTVDRDSFVVVSKTTDLQPDDVLANLAKPFDLQTNRHWLLSIFPMPYEINAGSLNAGDVHVVKTRYHRWFFTNTHEGELHLELVEVSDNKVRTRFVHDSTFFSSYLNPIGTEISLQQNESGETRVTLRIDYERKLDPAWYFHPLQQYGVEKMAEFLIDEVMIRDN